MTKIFKLQFNVLFIQKGEKLLFKGNADKPKLFNQENILLR